MKIVKIRLTQVDQVREFVELTSNCNYDVDLVSDRYTVDAKSLLGIYSLDLSNPLQVLYTVMTAKNMKKHWKNIRFDDLR